MTGGWLRGRLERGSAHAWMVILADGKPRTIGSRRVRDLGLHDGDDVLVLLNSSGGVTDAKAGTADTAALAAADAAGAGALFVNPYNFVPFSGPPSHNPEGLQPRLPAGHDRLHGDLFSGTIDVGLTVVTPLLLVDQSRAVSQAGHKTLPPRMGPDGRPLLAASAVRGALRSAYEAVTNSAFGVVDRRWQHPLAMRDPARNTLGVRLAKVSDDGTQLLLQADLAPLLPGGWNAHDPDAPLLPDPWLPITTDGPRHREQYRTTLSLWYHCPRGGQRGYYFWRGPGGSDTRNVVRPGKKKKHDPAGCRQGCAWPVAHKITDVKVTAHVTGKPALVKKHDERLFVDGVGDQITHRRVPITDVMRAAWDGVIDSYAAAHKPEEVRSGGLPPYVGEPREWRSLEPGDLVFAKESAAGDWVLRPAMISRVPFREAPAALTDGHLPAGGIGGLTAAERVFGWVGGTGSYAGHLVVEPPECTVDDWRGRGEDAQPLEFAVLNSPKPSYYRFYVESPGEEGKSQEGGYVAGGRLRGWKVYPHHRGLEGAAGEAVERAVGVARYTGGRDAGVHPNRRVTFSVRDWVRAGATFSVRLRFTNLTCVELGALLWVLDPDGVNGGLLRLGLGKPLGLGSVTSKVTGASVWRGAERWTAPDGATADVAAFREAFARAVAGHPIGRAMHAHLAASRGWDGIEIHYPRVRLRGSTDPAPPGQPGYLWFEANESGKGREALPALGEQAPSLRVRPVTEFPYTPG